MAMTKLQANWASVSFGGSPITRITGVNFTQGGSLAPFSGDGDRYPTVIVNLMSRPGCTITSADVAALMAIAPGTSGTISATHKDAKLASGGDIIYSLANAVAENCQASGPFGQYGGASLSFQAFSSDGITNPLSFTRA